MTLFDVGPEEIEVLPDWIEVKADVVVVVVVCEVVVDVVVNDVVVDVVIEVVEDVVVVVVDVDFMFVLFVTPPELNPC